MPELQAARAGVARWARKGHVMSRNTLIIVAVVVAILIIGGFVSV
ncbi:hypothetical protein [Roseivivax jejudonensis]|nr:hypothetical protein [Roseivivax jejudonensis]